MTIHIAVISRPRGIMRHTYIISYNDIYICLTLFLYICNLGVTVDHPKRLWMANLLIYIYKYICII